MSVPTTPISEVALVNPKPSSIPDRDEAVAFVGMAELNATTARASDVEMRPYSEVARGYTPFQDGDILLAKITPCFENMKIGQAHTSTKVAAGSTEFHVVRPRDGLLDGRYLLHFLRQNWVLDLGKLRMTGSAGQRRVPERFLDELQIPLPPIEEQRRIAAVLDAADDLRAKRRQSLAHLDALPQAIFFDMFGNPRSSTSARLADYVDVITKGTTPTSVGLEFTGSGVPFVRVQDLVAGTVLVDTIKLFVSAETSAALRRSILEPDDVLVSIAGTIGRIAVVPGDAPEMNCNQAVAIVRTAGDLKPLYLQAWMNTDHAQEQMLGSRVTGTISNLSLTSIRDLELPVPSASKQARFCGMVERVRALAKRAAVGTIRLDTLFGCLQQRAFRGEL